MEYSAQASMIASECRIWALSSHRAPVTNLLNMSASAVTTVLKRFNTVEARVEAPLQWGDYAAQIETAVCWQDDQPRPDLGTEAAFEVVLKLGI